MAERDNQAVNQWGQPIGVEVRNWAPPSWPKADVLQGRHVSLERLQPEQHAQGLYDAFAANQNPRSWTYLPYGPFTNFSDFYNWLTAMAGERDPRFYAILKRGEDAPLGVASYLRIKPDAGSIEVGHIHFSELMQKSPLSTEAMFLMMRYAFELGYRRYEWKCDALNAESMRAAKRLGFDFEGIFRQALVYKGRNRDTAWFSVLDQQWPVLDRAYREWLDEDNFLSGQQKQRLADLIKQYAASISVFP